MVDHVDGIFLVIQGGNPFTGKFTNRVNGAVIDEQVARSHGNQAQQGKLAIVQVSLGLGTVQGTDQGAQLFRAGNGAHGADRSAELGKRTQADISGGDNIALAGNKVGYRYAFIGVRG